MTKNEAIVRAESRYDSETACVNGHIGARITENDICVQCMYDELSQPRQEKEIKRRGPHPLFSKFPGKSAQYQTTPMNRNEARGLRLSKYMPFKPCGRGHYTFRYTNTGACVACIANYSKDVRDKYRVPKLRFKKLNVAVHADDILLVTEYVEALRFAREFDAGVTI